MTENEYVNKQTILDAIKSTKPEPSEYMDMTDNIVVNTIILGAAVKQYEDIVKIVEAAQPTTAELMIENEKLKEQLSVIRNKAKAVHDAVTELDSEVNL